MTTNFFSWGVMLLLIAVAAICGFIYLCATKHFRFEYQRNRAWEVMTTFVALSYLPVAPSMVLFIAAITLKVISGCFARSHLMHAQ